MAAKYDVIVIGAGPAGGTAAYDLGEAGRRVLVLEKARFPRYKTCGGGLSLSMLRSYFPFSFEPVVESRIRRVTFTMGRRRVDVPVGDGDVCTVMRQNLDAHILAHARADVIQGAAVSGVRQDPEGVHVETKDGRVFHADFALGADGANSVVARSLGLRRGRTMAAAIEVEAPAPRPALRRFGESFWFIFGDVPFGYAWVFPKEDHLSIGIGALHPRPGQLQDSLRRVADRLGVSLEGVPFHGHPIPIYSRKQRLTTGRVALVGDAAGLADPVTGEGIRLAIKSGRLAAGALRAGGLEDYDRLVFAHIGLSHMVGAGLAWLFYTFPDIWFRLGAANPWITSAFIDMLSDRSDYAATALTVFGSLPFSLGLEGVAVLARLVGRGGLASRLRSSLSMGTPSRSRRVLGPGRSD